MDITITPKKLSGSTAVIPSKSQAHRLLICSAFSDKTTHLICPAVNQDITATVLCLNALGANIVRIDGGYTVEPVKRLPKNAVLNCGESGSTLRFMLPIAGALGVDTVLKMEGRLPHRPLSPLWEEMERMGCQLSRPTENTIRCCGKLQPGHYTIDGSISSQFITGLLFALALINGKSTLSVTGKIESAPYIEMTRQALAMFNIPTEDYQFNGGQRFHTPGIVNVEGDWSNGAFWLAAKALGSNIEIQGLDSKSAQGDRAAEAILSDIDLMEDIDAADIPDLVPILAIVAGAKKIVRFTNIQRLRLKESDRVLTVSKMLQSLGATVTVAANELIVHPAKYHSCTIDASGDHRIAMAAAIAATVSDGPVTILGAQCVAKSYPSFWEEYRKLGGSYEQYIR